MRLTSLQLINWKNFTNAEADLHDRVFLVGPNASGKSNLLDALRFLRDIAAPEGGVQRAITERGGLAAIRSLSAPRNAEITIAISAKVRGNRLTYSLSLVGGEGAQPTVSREIVTDNGVRMLDRPNSEDKIDPLRLAQTHLEQVATNRRFRHLRDFLASIRYLHIAPEFIRQRHRIDATANDPYGSDFLQKVAASPEAKRHIRMRRINAALRMAIPQLDGIELDTSDREPRLTARFRNWRPTAPAQDELQFSDGTLRLFAFLWAVTDGTAPLLLEEPELSLHPGVVRHLVSLSSALLAGTERQVIISTHSVDVLSDEGIAPEEVLMLIPSAEGTEVRAASNDEQIRALLEGGLNVGDAVLPSTDPPSAVQIPLVKTS